MKNGVLLQAFHWEQPADGSGWRTLGDRAQELAGAGFTAVWLPPACKGAAGPDDVGYAVYDLYDLGEFEQKGSRRTKYGTREELVAAVAALRAAGLQVYGDVVLNHRQGADETEEVLAHAVDPHDRTRIDPELKPIRAWTRFRCPGRAGAHSTFEWNHDGFSSVDCDANAPDAPCLYLLAGHRFSDEVSDELGNFDHLLGCDVDFDVPAVREELCRWGEWFVRSTGVDGLRLDALKHIPAGFFRDFLAHVRARCPERELLAIGEYWSADRKALDGYLQAVDGALQLFDVPLHFRFVEAGRRGRDYDLRTIFDDTLVATAPLAAVTFVDNHDTQPGQSLESFVADWFKPLAYALILLRGEGYPCVFIADLDGHASSGDGGTTLVDHGHLIRTMMDVRRRYGHGDQHDHFDAPTCIAWVRSGDAEHPGSMVVVLSTADAATVRVDACAANAHFRDATGHLDTVVVTGDDGVADFPCPAGSLSIWVQI
jgi:alpha-amylase